MQKISITLALITLLTGCSSKSDHFPVEGRFKADKTPACDSVETIKAIVLNIKRGKVSEAQNQIDAGIKNKVCVLYNTSDTPIIKHLDGNYVKFQIKGTDNTPKRAFFTSAEGVNF